MFVDDFAKQLTRDLELDPPLSADDDGVYHLLMRESIPLEIGPHESGVAMSAVVGACPAEESGQREAFFSHLLLANLLGQGTGRSMLGLDGEGKEIRLILALPYEIPYLECRDYLEEFLNFAEFWVGEIERFITHEGQ